MAMGKDVRNDFKYSKDHEWVQLVDSETVLCGVTDYAQNNLGDIVFVELSIKDGAVKIDDTLAVVESAKAASDVYSPVSGRIIDVNSAIEDSPEILNASPYDTGWLCKIALADASELDTLMNAEQYTQFIAEAD